MQVLSKQRRLSWFCVFVLLLSSSFDFWSERTLDGSDAFARESQATALAARTHRSITQECRIAGNHNLAAVQQLLQRLADARVRLDLVVLAEDRDDIRVVHLGERRVRSVAQRATLLAQHHDEELAGLDGLDPADRLERLGPHAFNPLAR